MIIIRIFYSNKFFIIVIIDLYYQKLFKLLSKNVAQTTDVYHSRNYFFRLKGYILSQNGYIREKLYIDFFDMSHDFAILCIRENVIDGNEIIC